MGTDQLTYEYKTMRLVERQGTIPPQTIEQDLNTQGLLGWRLAEVVEVDRGAPLAILERPLPQEPQGGF